MDGGLIRDGANVGVLDANIEPFLDGEVVELVVDVVGVLYVLFEANNGEALKVLGLMNHGIQAI